MSRDKTLLLRKIPGVDEMLQSDAARSWLARYPRVLVVEAIRSVLGELREAILSQPENEAPAVPSLPDLAAAVQERLRQTARLSLRPVINATGVILHTNLGRSPLGPETLAHVLEVARGYANLEYDLHQGGRGKRYRHVERLLCRLTGAEAATVVNNNAAAVLLVLNTLAQGKEVVVSRGELVEIGGSFRIPEVMEKSGARLREVGTTNKTHLRDYEQAVGPDTGLLLKVHTSNYQIVGFAQEVPLGDLVRLGRQRGLPVMYDLGSGSFVDLRKAGIGREPTAQEAVRAGVDVVTFSGDKLLGGPQAGLIVGRRDLLEKIRSNPLARAVRVDKLTLAALEHTLWLYLSGEDRAVQAIPTLRMLSLSLPILARRARNLASAIRKATQGRLEVGTQPEHSQAGGGSLPLGHLPTRVVTLRPRHGSAARLEEALRRNDPPIVVRVKEGRLLLDPRTLLPGDAREIVRALERIASDEQ